MRPGIGAGTGGTGRTEVFRQYAKREDGIGLEPDHREMERGGPGLVVRSCERLMASS